ncbi:FAD-dependent monooxygenase [Pseudonocardia sp. ICBG1293]|uniref:FAD-dependent monooxygenase n=1 Tax=Pseudonocardia sp. ICBG1293 TaxID=2844382 RepID=UPI001CCBBB9E|nr:FAD-dependent monooxygenase [Pseudonocardia sp. ICBG1293]
MHVLIAGGGIGGLTTALALHRVGIGSTVFEQGSGAGELGVGFNLLPHAVRVLHDLGLAEDLAAVGIATTDLTYAHRLGQPILRRPCGVAAGFAVPQVAGHRGRVHRMLADAVRDRLGPDAVRTRHRVAAVADDRDGVRVRFTDPATPEATGDVLVGADGIHSAVRTGLFPGEGPPHWNGVSMWRGATDWPAFRGGRSMVVAGGNAAKLVVYPVGAGSAPGTVLTNWAVCIATGVDGDPAPQRQDWSRPADREETLAHARRFQLDDVDHLALIAATPGIFGFPMCDRDPLPHWSRGRVTLLDDAAHPMVPMGSNGAGQAILDAASLAGHLSAAATPQAALAASQAERLPTTAEVVLRNRMGGPERVIDEVERRAPDGFDDLDAVITGDELEEIFAGYHRASGNTR